MRKLTYPVLALAILLILPTLVSVAVALDVPQQIIRHVEGSAGQKVAAGPFILNGTLGEPVAGPVITAGGFNTSSGYWKEITHNTRIFLPVIVR